MTTSAGASPLADGVVVVKVGGELLRDAAQVDRIAGELAVLYGIGVPLIVVHGGGPQATELSARLGVRSTVIDGRRVTDASTLDVVKMVFAGRLNTDLVAALNGRGAPAVGLSGIDAGMLRVHRRPPVERGSGAQSRVIDFGYVGDVDGVEADLLLHLAYHGYLPVVCSLAADAAGTVLNVNADTVAGAIAVQVRARRLVLLTTVAGVYEDFPANTILIEHLDIPAARRLVRDGAARTGMVPKLEACIAAVERGLGEAWIAGGDDPMALRNAASGLPGAGTRIVAAGTPGSG
jgi:acetylglutamate kinase